MLHSLIGKSSTPPTATQADHPPAAVLAPRLPCCTHRGCLALERRRGRNRTRWALACALAAAPWAPSPPRLARQAVWPQARPARRAASLGVCRSSSSSRVCGGRREKAAVLRQQATAAEEAQRAAAAAKRADGRIKELEAALERREAQSASERLRSEASERAAAKAGGGAARAQKRSRANGVGGGQLHRPPPSLRSSLRLRRRAPP